MVKENSRLQTDTRGCLTGLGDKVSPELCNTPAKEGKEMTGQMWGGERSRRWLKERKTGDKTVFSFFVCF